MTANDTGQAGNVLTANRVAFMRHSRGALLTFSKSLFHLAEFTLLQSANFCSKFIKRSSDQSQSRHIFSMTITLQRLSRNRSGLRAQLFTYELLYQRIDVRISTYRTGNFTVLNIVGSMAEALQVTFHFFVPKRHFQTKGCRLGMYPVRTAHHWSILVGYRFIMQNFDEVYDVLLQNFVGLLQ
ncbi:hypothetical protein D3C80_1148230 [compost metagenome]